MRNELVHESAGVNMTLFLNLCFKYWDAGDGPEGGVVRMENRQGD